MEKKNLNRIVLLCFIGLMIGGFFFFDLNRFLTLAYLKESQHRFMVLYEHHSALVIAVYMLVYIITTALSLPGAAVLTIAGGAMFGLVTGTIAVSFASSLGATLACLVSRFLLQDWVQEKFGDRLEAINGGIEKEGLFYLFSLRLVPIFPFFVINLVMGLTKMPLFSFYWVSQIGMLPATIIYVNAGKELAKIDSLSGILSPGLLLSFAILGLFPLLVKRLLRFYRKRTSSGSIAE